MSILVKRPQLPGTRSLEAKGFLAPSQASSAAHYVLGSSSSSHRHSKRLDRCTRRNCERGLGHRTDCRGCEPVQCHFRSKITDRSCLCFATSQTPPQHRQAPWYRLSSPSRARSYCPQDRCQQLDQLTNPHVHKTCRYMYVRRWSCNFIPVGKEHRGRSQSFLHWA